MKWLFILLSVYILVLSVMPCCDGEQTHAEETLRVSAKAHKHDGPLAEMEVCSPFFGCHCCTGFTLSLDAITVSRVAVIDAPQAVLRPLALSSIPTAIWHPPKVA